MKIQELHVGMKVLHPQHGLGTVKSITENMAEIGGKVYSTGAIAWSA